jgi:hypothetical protein
MKRITPIERMIERLESTKSDSDLAYFYDLLLLGEQITKTITLFLVACINEDNERTKYRYEHFLVRASAIGDFSKTIDDVLVGPAAQILSPNIRDLEYKELTQRVSNGSWQFESLSQLESCLDLFNIQRDKLGVKSPLRMWFHLFTLLRNKTKGHGATKTEPCSEACPLLLNSIMLILDNLSLFKRPWAYFFRNLSGKYRISYLLEDLNEFDFLKRENNENFENGVYCLVDYPRKINLLYSNPELFDFYYPNGNLKNDKFETISYISDDRIEKCAKAYMNPVTSLPSSETEGLSQLDILGNCFTNLPVPSDNYIKREKLEAELKSVISIEDRFPIITLKGRGGIGKTSLAIHVIREQAFTNRYDLIVWFSARDIDLHLEGPKQVQTKVLNQKDIASDYCRLLYPDTKIEDKIDFFSKELTKNSFGKALYVFDNFETITNPIEVFEWINTYVRNPNKILITSRINRNFKADYPIEVGGMSDNECRELISSLAEKFNIQKIITNKYIEDLITESDGHPYIIKILLGEVAKTKKIRNIQRIVAENDKVLSALFKRTFDTLSPAAKRVFLTLCSWSSSIPQIAIEAVLWRPENEKIDVQGAIDELQKSSFIELFNDAEETLVNVPLAAAIFGKTELEVYPEKLKILSDRTLLLEFGASNQKNFSNGLAPRIERKFSEVAKRIKSLDEFKIELPSLEYIASRFPKAWLHICNIYQEYDDFDGMKYALRELLKTVLPNDEKAKWWLKLADICKFTKDWEGESHALSELATINGISYDLISDCANRINYYFKYHPIERQVEYKQMLLQKIIDIMIKRIREATPTDYSRLAWLLLNNNNQSLAFEYVERGLAIDSENSHCLRLLDKINSF